MMKLTEETKNLLFVGGMFLWLVVATGILVRDYRQEKSAEKARIAEIQALAAYEQAKWEWETYIKLMPLLAEYEAKREVEQRENDEKFKKEGGLIVRIDESEERPKKEVLKK